jgi:hypothetical protein
MSEKKDVLDFPLEEVEVPQAIALMMQAATKCHFPVGTQGPDGTIVAEAHVDMERLQLLCEKLEARVEDALDEAKAIRTEPAVEDAPNDVPLVETDIFLMEDGEVLNYKGILYKKSCNRSVVRASDGAVEDTYCIKQWGHQNPIHEDEFGNESR